MKISSIGMNRDQQQFINNCCCLDLETTVNGEIFAVGAELKGNSFIAKAPFKVRDILGKLDVFTKNGAYLLGHNLLQHDLPVCRAISANHDFLNKPVVDTLFLSPLAFPENPYHRLVKNYKLVQDGLNDPLADALLAKQLFLDQWQALQNQDRDILSFYYYAFSGNSKFSGLRKALLAMGGEVVKTNEALGKFKHQIKTKVCNVALEKVTESIQSDPEKRIASAYCLSWLRVAGGNSVLPPWVRLQFEDVAPILRQLRDIPCTDNNCGYCRETHNSVEQLKQFFGFKSFRKDPATDDGKSLQQQMVQAAMSDTPMFAILPTGGGKSLCYQLPALVRYQRRGVLTIIISPLQALMKDQVDNLRNKTGAPNTAALYGMLTAPERGEVLKAIQMGDIAVLYISPEQLRNRSFQQAIEYREIGCWVFDEAHCLSKWGHDFRPDYLYAARFIEEFAEKQKALLPPVQCFTATAKQNVRDEIIDYFRANLAQELVIFEGGMERNNLQFEVQTVTVNDKLSRINQLLKERLGDTGSAIIYCAKQKQTEFVAEYLEQLDWQVEAFHAGKDIAEKKHIQENFITGVTRIITATNAFGMGIDKEDVRLVIHADIPGSLENYLQEAGRAGRDQQQAECILLFDENDIDTQFKLSAASQISQRDITQILKGLRKSRTDKQGNVVLTTGELLMDDNVDASFDNEDYSADTKVKTAVSWLEKSGFIQRNENRTQVFQGRPMVKNMEEAQQKITSLGLSKRQQQRWSAIIKDLFNAKSDEGFSADELAQHNVFLLDEQEKADKNLKHRTASQLVIRTLHDMAEAGIIQKQLLLTAFVRYKVANASKSVLNKVCELEKGFIQILQEQAPDAQQNQWQQLSLRLINQYLLDQGYEQSNPEILRLLLSSLSRDGQGLAGKIGSLTIRHKGLDQYKVKLNRNWKSLERTAQIRQTVAQIVLQAIINRIPERTAPSADVLVEFAEEDLLKQLKRDLVIWSELKDPLAATERALNFLHEQKVITLQKGLAVFRQAMTIQVLPDAKGRRYTKGDYEPLSQHYGERIFQVHVINEYARQGLEKIGQALTLVVAYFSMDKAEFVKRYFADRKEVIERATSQQSFQRIVTDLQNPQQEALVACHENENLLILAGPGSGKTRVVVHRCAYLIRVKQVPPRNILVLCFNRNAVTELRRRLLNLIGDDAKQMVIQTYHGLSLRLTGHAMTVALNQQVNRERHFSEIIQQAIQLLQGEKSLLGIESDEIRDRLLAGFRYILVDEYQDIDEDQYQLVSAIAGRTLDEESKLTLLAVGDDDQNIYQFRGANIGFIREFKEDYHARVAYLVENYRSSANIIAASNQLITHNLDRMKQHHPIRINQGRKNLPPGGRWHKLDTLAKGRVQKIIVENELVQAQAVVEEILRLKQLDSQLEWTQCVILAREWQILDSLKAVLEANQIPLSLALPADRQPPPYRIRENVDLLGAIKRCQRPAGTAEEWLNYLDEKYQGSNHNPWVEQLKKMLRDWKKDTGNAEVNQFQTLEFLYETLSEQRREHRLGDGVFLCTVHSVKGMEFSHVFILDGGWKIPANEEQTRLYYVAMTRAKETLCLMQRQDQKNPLLNEISGNEILQRQVHTNLPELLLIHDRFEVLGLRDFDLSYAGRLGASHPIHQQLSAMEAGTELNMEKVNNHLVLKYRHVTVARLSKTANQQWLTKINQIKSIKVLAMIKRYRDDNGKEYQIHCLVDQWELPFVEIRYTV
jgi:ATP-dependent DNA helicase RecQ